MAVITKTLKSSGGDYSLMSTWESTEQTDLVSDGDSHVLEVYGGDFGGTDGALAETRIDIAGWTTSATYDITIHAPSGEEHGGVRRKDGGTGFLMETSLESIRNGVKNLTLQGFELIAVSGYVIAITALPASSVIVAERLMLDGGSIFDGHSANYASVTVRNCLGFGGYEGIKTELAVSGEISNCTFFADTRRAIQAGANLVVKNCVAVAPSQAFVSTTHASNTNNASSDSSAPGSSPQTSISSSDGVDFVEPSTGDYTPESGGKLDGNGADLSGTFTDDITGTTRSTWDIGAYIAAAGGAVTVSPDDVNQSQSIDNVTLTQANVLAVDDLSQGQSIDGATLTQANVLAVADIDQGQSLGNVTLTQAHVIVVNDLDQGQSLDNITLTSAGSLAVAGITQAQLIDAVALTQAHILAVDGIGQGQSIDNVTLAVAGSLAVQAVTQGQSLDGVALTQQGSLAVGDLTQAQLIEAATLAQHYQLAVQGLLQGQLLDNVTLSAGSLSIAPDDLTQGQAVDPIALTEYAVLAVNDLTQSQIIDIVSLGGLVIGELEGTLVVYALLDGDIVTKALLTGSITLH